MGMFRRLVNALKRNPESCSHGRLVSISYANITNAPNVSGSLLECIYCGRRFCPPSVVLEDQRTLQSLQEYAAGREVRNAPDTLLIAVDATPPKTTIYRCTVGRSFLSQVGMRYLRTALWGCVLRANTPAHQRIPERITIDISGYSDDQRELWEIPEVAEFFYMLHEEIPGIEFWMPIDYLRLFVRVATAGVPQIRRDELLSKWIALHRAATDLHLAPATPEFGSPELAQFLLAESVEQVDSFLKSELSGREPVAKALKNDSALYQVLGLA